MYGKNVCAGQGWEFYWWTWRSHFEEIAVWRKTTVFFIHGFSEKTLFLLSNPNKRRCKVYMCTHFRYVYPQLSPGQRKLRGAPHHFLSGTPLLHSPLWSPQKAAGCWNGQWRTMQPIPAAFRWNFPSKWSWPGKKWLCKPILLVAKDVVSDMNRNL